MQATKITNFNEALTAITAATSERKYTVQLPSLSGREITLKEISAGQQKELLKSIVDSPFYKTRFIMAFYDILKNNYQDETILLDSLTIIDKQSIILKSRIECFGSNYELNSDTKLVNNVVDLNLLYAKVKNTKQPDPRIINIDGFELKLKIPTIKDEYNLEQELHSNIDKLDTSNTATIRNVLGDIFTAEISKYIEYININDMNIDFTPLTSKNRIQLLEKLSTKTVQEVIKFIDEIKEIIDSLATVEVIEKDTDKIVIEKIEIDGGFFVLK